MTEVIDSRAFSEFCGVNSSNQVPDGDTIGRFRNILVKTGEEDLIYGDSGYLGANKRENAVVKNKSGKKITYKINRRPSQIKKLSNNEQYQANKSEHKNHLYVQRLSMYLE